MSNLTFSPLSTWPGVPTPAGKRRRSAFSASHSKTITLLNAELKHLNAKNVVVEADCDASEIRRDGQLRANAKMRGPGIVVSFESDKGAMRFPCDAFLDWTGNLRAIALSLEALRKVDRYGVTRQAEQYRGWQALPDGRQPVSKKRLAAEWIVQELISSVCVENPPTVSQIIGDDQIRKSAILQLKVFFHPDRKFGDAEKFKILINHIEALEEA